jgi:outer membrane protein assembly factor BamB
MPRKLVAVNGKVYVPLGIRAPISELDGATGQHLRTFTDTKTAEELIIHQNILLTLSNDNPPDPKAVEKERRSKRWWMYDGLHRAFLKYDGGRRIVAIGLNDGKTLWDVPFEQIAPLSLTAAGNRVLVHDGRRIQCLDLKSGSGVWKSAELPVAATLVSEESPSLTVHDDVVLYAWQGTVHALDFATGKEMWRNKFLRADYRSPASLFVLDGLVWYMDITQKKADGKFTGYDLRTGEVVRSFVPNGKFTGMGHHRCYRARATQKYVLAARSGVELVDVVNETWREHFWVRGACLYGVMPANGMIYSTPHPCACYIKSKLNGYSALGPRRTEFPDLEKSQRLFKGPAFGYAYNPEADQSTWPTFRHDPQRSGAVDYAVSIPTHLKWTSAKLGAGVGQVTSGGGMVFAADKAGYTITALKAADGSAAWTFQAGGRIDSPPPFHAGRLYFGGADGFVYCLKADDGFLVWRLRAAPEPRQIGAFSRLESVWPVHGSVLIQTNPKTGKAELFCAAGRSSYLDGGIRLLRIDPADGTIFAEQTVYHRDLETGEELNKVANFEQDGCLNDILSGDGQSIYLRHARFSADAFERMESDSHLYSSTGYLDYTWWHRSYWVYGENTSAGYGGWWQKSFAAPSGRMLVMNDNQVFGFGRDQTPGQNSAEFSRGERYHLFASPRLSKDELIAPDFKEALQLRKQGKDNEIKWAKFTTLKNDWSRRLPMHVRAMALAKDRLFIAGPMGEGIVSREAYEGRLGSSLVAVDAASGEVLQSVRLPFLPAFDGLSVAGSTLILTGADGMLRCYGTGGGEALETFKMGDPIDFKEELAPWPEERMVVPGSPNQQKKQKSATGKVPASAIQLSPEKAGYDRLLDGKLYKAEGGITLVSDPAREAVALQALPRPLKGEITFTVTLTARTGWGRPHENAFLVFGHGEETEKLSLCGIQAVVDALGTADGHLGKKTRKVKTGRELNADTPYPLTVIYDTNSGKYTALLGDWQTVGKFRTRTGGVTHVGISSYNAASAFNGLTWSQAE